MKDFDAHLKKSKKIAESAEAKGNLAGQVIPWLMISVGVVVTGIQTHELAYNGMKGSQLYAEWLDIAAWLPVILLEGTAIGLTAGRLYFFKSTEQRRLGLLSSFGIWAILAVNTIAQFVLGSAGSLPAPFIFYTRYVLPLTIVAVPYLWKWLLDLHPDSQERIATLEVNAEYSAKWRGIQRQHNEQIIEAYEEALQSDEVKQAVENLTQKAAVLRAAQIIGAIDPYAVNQAKAELQEDMPPPRRIAPLSPSGATAKADHDPKA